MTETQTLTFDTKTIKDLMFNYYKDYFQDDSIKILYDVIEEDEYSYASLRTKIIKKLIIGKYIGESYYYLSNEDVIKVINKELANYNKKIEHFNYNIVGKTWNGASIFLKDVYVKKKELRKEWFYEIRYICW